MVSPVFQALQTRRLKEKPRHRLIICPETKLGNVFEYFRNRHSLTNCLCKKPVVTNWLSRSRLLRRERALPAVMTWAVLQARSRSAASSAHKSARSNRPTSVSAPPYTGPDLAETGTRTGAAHAGYSCKINVCTNSGRQNAQNTDSYSSYLACTGVKFSLLYI